MPLYEYTAISGSGRNTKGSIDAENVRAARQRLRGQGIFPTTIKEGQSAVENKTRDVKKYFLSNRVSAFELSVATRQLATLVGAGLPLVSALAALADQSESEVLKRTIVSVRENVEQGASLARALGEFPKVFPRLYINLVASGEASGTLDTVLDNLATHLEAQMKLRNKVLSALAYPALMLVICTLVITALLVYVVPKIVAIFQKQNLALPLPTQIVLGLSHLVTSYWYLLILSVLLALMGAQWYYRNPQGRARIDAWMLKLPIVGNLYIKISTARACRTLSTLLSSGVELLTALDIVRNIVNNVHMIAAFERARDGIREGRSLAQELSKSAIFPTMLCHMIAVGEKSGELESMLSRAATSYENEVEAALSGLTSLLEPLLMVIVGGIVLFIVLSILLPMADLISNVQR
ncbi:MAG: type II secretion system inner membrane protein GspF [Oligoflexia bacterium]|nr:type II secretion system inner membrane protein GspF [Oligoflexia bacterium]